MISAERLLSAGGSVSLFVGRRFRHSKSHPAQCGLILPRAMPVIVEKCGLVLGQRYLYWDSSAAGEDIQNVNAHLSDCGEVRRSRAVRVRFVTRLSASGHTGD